MFGAVRRNYCLSQINQSNFLYLDTDPALCFYNQEILCFSLYLGSVQVSDLNKRTASVRFKSHKKKVSADYMHDPQPLGVQESYYVMCL